jgi:hypothetical protein
MNSYDPTTILGCFELTTFMVSAWALLSSAEWLANIRLFGTNGLLSWSVLGLRYGARNRSRVATKLSSPEAFAAIQVLRIAGSLLAISFGATPLGVLGLALVLVSCSYVTHRACFGGDGSDQMGAILTAGAFVMGLGLYVQDEHIARAGAFLIAGQSVLSYFVAGAAKLASGVWRSGEALSGVMSTQTYGHVLAAKLSFTSPRFCGFFCWAVIVTEMAFPIVLVAPMPILAAGLIGFAAFHISNAVFMGLNAFVIAFVGTYPSVIYLNGLIRAAWFAQS